MLLKVRAPPGQARTEILQLVDIFRSRVVDVGDASLTICATGDAGRVSSCLSRLQPVQVKELTLEGTQPQAAACTEAAAVVDHCAAAAAALLQREESAPAPRVDSDHYYSPCSSCSVPAAVQTYAFQRALAKYGIIELARTGKICLKRGEELLEMGGWGEGSNPPGSPSAELRARQPERPASPSAGGDVYVSDDDGTAGAQFCASSSESA